MNRYKLINYIDSIIGITNSIQNPKENKFAKKCTRSKYFVMGFDQIVIYDTDQEIIVSIATSNYNIKYNSNSTIYPVVNNTHNLLHDKADLYLNTISTILNKWVTQTKKPVVFTGYSISGALAQVMCNKFGNNSSCATFGSPRVFTISGSKLLSFNHIRVYHKFDKTIHIPMFLKFPFFKHYETQKIKLNKKYKGKLTLNTYKQLLIDYYKK